MRDLRCRERVAMPWLGETCTRPGASDLVPPPARNLQVPDLRDARGTAPCRPTPRPRARPTSARLPQLLQDRRAHGLVLAWSGFVRGELAVRCAPAFRRLACLVAYAGLSARTHRCCVRGPERVMMSRLPKAQWPRTAPRSSSRFARFCQVVVSGAQYRELDERRSRKTNAGR
jgi:hypothetical protein